MPTSRCLPLARGMTTKTKTTTQTTFSAPLRTTDWYGYDYAYCGNVLYHLLVCQWEACVLWGLLLVRASSAILQSLVRPVVSALAWPVVVQVCRHVVVVQPTENNNDNDNNDYTDQNYDNADVTTERHSPILATTVPSWLRVPLLFVNNHHPRDNNDNNTSAMVVANQAFLAGLLTMGIIWMAYENQQQRQRQRKQQQTRQPAAEATTTRVTTPSLSENSVRQPCNATTARQRCDCHLQESIPRTPKTLSWAPIATTTIMETTQHQEKGAWLDDSTESSMTMTSTTTTAAFQDTSTATITSTNPGLLPTIMEQGSGTVWDRNDHDNNHEKDKDYFPPHCDVRRRRQQQQGVVVVANPRHITRRGSV